MIIAKNNGPLGGAMLIFAIILLLLLTTNSNIARAGLLDNVMGPVEKKLSEKVEKKGEKLVTGNFYQAERPDSHAPIGVMGDHTHNEGEFMFSFRWMQMYMNGMMDGTRDQSTAEVLQDFMVTPTKMTTNMYMFSAMYGFNKTLTLMAMLPWIEKSMDHVTRMGTTFTTNSSGVGDIKITTLWRLWAVEAPSIGAHRFHLNLGVSVPSGDITPVDFTPAGGADTILPYPMRLGTGTVGILPGLTYAGATENWSWNFQAIGDVQIGENSRDYTVGPRYQINGLGAYRWTDWISNSVRFNWRWWDNYSGRDPALNPMMIPTADPGRLGGERLDVLFGANILFPEWMDVENRLAIEGGFPVYQNLSGPQLGTDYVIWAGYQFVK